MREMQKVSTVRSKPAPQKVREELTFEESAPQRGRRRSSCALAIAVSALSISNLASAQTWTGGRSTPNLGEIVALDATGEDDWLFGAEDVAGDGLGTFTEQEQAIDIRSAYAATSGGEFRFRLYVSSSSSPGGNVSGYVFIDSDRSDASGGTAIAPEIDERFSSDASTGGYEYVFAVQGNGNVLDLWEWDAETSEFVSVMLTPNRASAESGTDVDPVTARAGEQGYLQGSIELGLIGLNDDCDGSLYFRSLNDTGAAFDGDLDGGVVGSCRPQDSNADRVPDVLVPREPCTANDQCPANAVCANRRCVFTALCDGDGDCDADQECNPDGHCVVLTGANCSEAADCSTRRCSNDECARCTTDSQCEEGLRCAADGRCFSEDEVPPASSEPPFSVGPDEEVQGGACTCSLVASSSSEHYWALLLPLMVAWLRRRAA